MREINLLPPERRQWLMQQAVSVALHRFLATLTYALGLSTITALIALAVAWISTQTIPQHDAASVANAVTEYNQIRDQIAEQNNLLKYVANRSAQRVVWSDFLRSFFDVVPPDVTIATLRAQATVGELKPPPSLNISGNAAARSALTIMQDRLQILPGVVDVTAPATNLIKRDNPPYQFTVLLKDPNGDNGKQ